jgi:hypothetical protein
MFSEEPPYSHDAQLRENGVSFGFVLPGRGGTRLKQRCAKQREKCLSILRIANLALL